MVEKSSSPIKGKLSGSQDLLGGKSLDGSMSQSQIKFLDGNYSDKERRQVVMKLIQFMKAA